MLLKNYKGDEACDPIILLLKRTNTNFNDCNLKRSSTLKKYDEKSINSIITFIKTE